MNSNFFPRGWHTLWDWFDFSGGASFTLSVKGAGFRVRRNLEFFTCIFTRMVSAFAVLPRTNTGRDALQVVGST